MHDSKYGRSPQFSRRSVILAAPALLALPLPVSARTAGDPVAALARRFVATDKGDAVSIAILHGGQTRFYNAGTTSRETRQPASENTIYEIGSITKTFTGLLLAHAIVERRASLDDDIRRHLPAGYDALVGPEGPVRLKHLVATTSALPDNLPPLPMGAKPEEMPFRIAESLAPYSEENFLADLRGAKLVDVPGAEPRHSNVAAQLEGLILQKIYGKPYEALLADFIERPLRMRTGSGDAPPPLSATGYDNGRVMPYLTARAARFSGGLRYSTADMARYIAAQIARADAAIRLTQVPNWGSEAEAAVGFNWMISRTIDSRLRLRHSGGTFGFSSYAEFYPELGFGSVVLTNRPGRAQDWVQNLAEEAFVARLGTPPVQTALERELAADGFANVAAVVARVQRRFPRLHLAESYINRWAYGLLASQPRNALGLFVFNVERYPQSWNAHDSVGDGYAAVRDTQNAVRHYRRSLELNPGNGNARDRLKELAPGTL